MSIPVKKCQKIPKMVMALLVLSVLFDVIETEGDDFEEDVDEDSLPIGVLVFVVYLNYYLYLCTRFTSKEWNKADS